MRVRAPTNVVDRPTRRVRAADEALARKKRQHRQSFPNQEDVRRHAKSLFTYSIGTFVFEMTCLSTFETFVVFSAAVARLARRHLAQFARQKRIRHAAFARTRRRRRRRLCWFFSRRSFASLRLSSFSFALGALAFFAVARTLFDSVKRMCVAAVA